MSAVGQCQYDLLCELGAHDPTEQPCRRGEPVAVVPVPVPVEPAPEPVEPVRPAEPLVQAPPVLYDPVPGPLPLGPTDRR